MAGRPKGSRSRTPEELAHADEHAKAERRPRKKAPPLPSMIPKGMIRSGEVARRLGADNRILWILERDKVLTIAGRTPGGQRYYSPKVVDALAARIKSGDYRFPKQSAEHRRHKRVRNRLRHIGAKSPGWYRHLSIEDRCLSLVYRQVKQRWPPNKTALDVWADEIDRAVRARIRAEERAKLMDEYGLK